MVIIKRLYSYMLQRFLPLFAMTFFICLFIVMMQFLWKSIDDLVGKGLEVSVIAELFFYAALTMVPMALPLAVLLASLMVFGNLGEKFELTAMKASGISLFRIMKPLTIFMVLVAIAAFFFQNNVLPVAQTKMWTLLFSVRQKSPEVEIPERSFYGDIPNMQLYVQGKNAETGMLYGMMIYDFSRGQENSRVILADSGRFDFTEDRTRLFLHLHSGELFENMQNTGMGTDNSRYLPFRREQFDDKQIYFPFNANFNRVDEGGLRSQYIGQNVAQLRHSIDSIGRRVDSIGNVYAADLLATEYFGLSPTVNRMENGEITRVRRSGHTEAAVDLARLAGLQPAAALMEIMTDDGDMARLPELRRMADRWGMKLVSIRDLIAYRLESEQLVEQGVEVDMPTAYGHFRLIPFRQKSNGLEHIAIIKGDVSTGDPVLVRVHSSCATGDIFGSLRCDCGEQLRKALQMIETEGRGAVVYLNQEGRGIGLMDKIRAYKLQEEGLDTVEANLHLGHDADERDYGVGAQILNRLGISKMKLMTNNPIKRVGLEGYGLEVVENVHIEVQPNPYNLRYMHTKKARMGHDLYKVE